MATTALRVFLVEDDPDYASVLRFQIRRLGNVEVHHYTSGEEMLAHLRQAPDLILLDIVMPGQGGLETLRKVKAQRTETPVVMVSGQTNVGIALEAINMGAYDYVTKGHDDTVKVRAIIQHVAERAMMTREIAQLRDQLPARQGLETIIGESPAMARVFRLIKKVLRGDLTVAIQGESGTGKELVAQAIHHNSDRHRGPFVVVNCAAIPHELMESEFFGHEKGSFTGAYARKIGKFEQADGGTIFLDEVGELNLDLQAKLLRALQNREITRIGGNALIQFDARILCATNRDILEMVRNGSFREDLYYRLFQFPIMLPALRERDQDVLLLAESFRKDYLKEHAELEDRSFATSTRRLMVSYEWPGNVRELKSAIERALLVSETPQIMPDDLMLDVVRPGIFGGPASEPERPDANVDIDAALPATPLAQIQQVTRPEDLIPLEEIKQLAVMHAYEVCGGNIEKTASHLDVARSTIYRVLRRAEAKGDDT